MSEQLQVLIARPLGTDPHFTATQDFRSTQKYIRQIAEMSKAILNTPPKPGGAEAKRLDLIMAANVQTALATKVQELSGSFRKKQTAYLRRESSWAGARASS